MTPDEHPEPAVDLTEAFELVDLTEALDLEPLTPEQAAWAEQARRRLRIRDRLNRKETR